MNTTAHLPVTLDTAVGATGPRDDGAGKHRIANVHVRAIEVDSNMEDIGSHPYVADGSHVLAAECDYLASGPQNAIARFEVWGECDDSAPTSLSDGFDAYDDAVTCARAIRELGAGPTPSA